MNDLSYLSLPLKTWLIVGGMFVLSALLPCIIALILKIKKVLD